MAALEGKWRFWVEGGLFALDGKWIEEEGSVICFTKSGSYMEA